MARAALPDAKERAAQLGRILALKNRAAYESRDLTPRECADVLARMERFVDWALENVP